MANPRTIAVVITSFFIDAFVVDLLIVYLLIVDCLIVSEFPCGNGESLLGFKGGGLRHLTACKILKPPLYKLHPTPFPEGESHHLTTTF